MIISFTNPDQVKFKELDVGTIFTWLSNNATVMMKIHPCRTMGSALPCEALNLSEGHVFSIDPDNYVIPYKNSKLTVAP